MSVVILKMVNGEELIARETLTPEGKLEYGSIRMLHVDTQQHTVGLAPWLIMGPDVKVRIQESGILAKAEAPTEIEKHYLQSVSGLELAKSMPQNVPSILTQGR